MRTRAARLATVAAALVTAGLAGSGVTSAATGTATSGTRVVRAASAVSCVAAEGFTRLSSGRLYRMTDPTLLGAPGTLAENGAVGSGWGDFAWTGAGGDGVLYALTRAGKLLWYRYDTATPGWAPGSGSVVATGLVPRTTLVNIAVGANGWIYVVRSDRRLVLMQHTGRLTGAATWAVPGGTVLGAGWTATDILAPQGDGVLYRQSGGTLYWYRHTDPVAGPVTWSGGGRGVAVGSGWRFYDVLALGAGVLVATSAPRGEVTLWQHADPAGGGRGWVVTGLAKYTARADSYGVSLAPGSCA